MEPQMERSNWFTRLALIFFGPSQSSPISEPRTSPEVTPGPCPRCGEPLESHTIRRSDSKSFTQCPRA